MPTIKDVAEKAHITVTTVSRVLNNRGYISEKTRKRVFQAMEELNYRPNELARALSKKHANIIGVIVPSILHPFFSAVVNHLEYYAAQNGFKLMVCNSHHNKESEIEYIDMLRSNKVSGIVICTRTGDFAKNLDESFPVVTFERSISGNIPAVMCDNYQGGVLAARCLLEAGCRHPAVLSGSPSVQLPADLRAGSFMDTCKQAGVESLNFNTNEEQFAKRQYTDTIDEILQKHPEIDGIFATSDVMAAQVLQVCAHRGLSVPKDLKVVGFDDVELAALTTPALTTIHQPVEKMCEYAIECIQRKLNGETIPVKTVLPVQLIRRESVTGGFPGKNSGSN